MYKLNLSIHKQKDKITQKKPYQATQTLHYLVIMNFDSIYKNKYKTQHETLAYVIQDI